MTKLTAKQKTFVAEYLIDLNATQAAIRAGYSEKTAEQMAYKLVQKSSVQEAIQEAMKKREQRTEITQDKVLAELAKLAFTDTSNFVKVVTETHLKRLWNEEAQEYEEKEVEEQYVKLADTDSLSPDTKAVISSIKHTQHGIVVESYDKIKSLELLGKHLGMFKDKIEFSGNMNNPFEGLTEDQLRKLAGDSE